MSKSFANLARDVRSKMESLPDCCVLEGFTYLIAGADMIKIGFSTDPSARIVSLQTGSPAVLSLVALARGNVEGWLHSRCSPHRAHGEWFSGDGVMRELADPLAMLEPYRLCLGCALTIGPSAAKRRLVERTAPTIAFRTCTREWSCRPTCWFTNDGRVSCGFYGDIACKRTLRTAERLGVLTPDTIAHFSESQPLPTDDMADLATWRPGCLRCAVLDGEVVRNETVARALARFCQIDDELTAWALAVARGEKAA